VPRRAERPLDDLDGPRGAVLGADTPAHFAGTRLDPLVPDRAGDRRREAIRREALPRERPRAGAKVGDTVSPERLIRPDRHDHLWNARAKGGASRAGAA
jgi:hypothetical protein